MPTLQCYNALYAKDGERLTANYYASDDELAAWKALNFCKKNNFELIDVIPMKYFPNNWQAIKDADERLFKSLPYEQLVAWKDDYVLPSSIFCLIREINPKTRKVTEYTYSSESAAKAKFVSLMNRGAEFIVCHHGAIEHLYPEDL